MRFDLDPAVSAPFMAGDYGVRDREPAPFVTGTCAGGTAHYELSVFFSLREVPWILALRTFARFLVTGGSGPGNLRRLWQVPAPFMAGDYGVRDRNLRHQGQGTPLPEN